MNDSSQAPLSDQERLVRGILSSLTAALKLVVKGREHHALCMRAFDMTVMYEKEWPVFYAERWPSYEKDTQEALGRWYGYLKNNAQSAQEQRDRSYSEVKQRTVIFLADILENLIGSFLQVCLKYVDGRVDKIDIIIGPRARNLRNEGDIKRAVRAWEKRISLKSRLARISQMIGTFFPSFRFIIEKQRNLDAMISDRNRLTHDLIVISHENGLENIDLPVSIDEEQVQRYFDDMGDFIIALLDAFRETVTDKSRTA